MRGRALGQVERAEIGAAPQDGFVGELGHHRVREIVDDLKDDRCRLLNVPCVPVLDSVMTALTGLLGSAGRPQIGRQHELDDGYFARIEAMDFAMRHDDGQFIDELEGTRKETFLLHYNFPPYSVGETGRMGSPGRREIGHGKLAWRAIRPMLPAAAEFPYTLRVVSEITESNGSSSMATVCGTSLALMDAGVPIKAPTAGIAMGLILEGERFAVLSDILGDEDHLGDMDFKVAGTENGVTSLQMDIKIAGITEEIMKKALAQAKDGRIHILGEMAKAIDGARPDVGEFAPKIETMSVPLDKIREVIGTGGKVIREIVATTGAKVDIADDGTIKIAAVDAMASQRAVDWIRGLTASPEVGTIYDGKVARVVDFGAFITFLGSQDGLCHISELANNPLGALLANLFMAMASSGPATTVNSYAVQHCGESL